MTLYDKEVLKVTITGMFVSLLLSSIQFFAGWQGESQGLVAESIHTFYDLIGSTIVLIFVRHWTKPPDYNHPYGHARIETVVSLFIGITMLPMALGIALNAIITFNEVHLSPPPGYTLIAIVLAIFGQRILYHWTLNVARKIKSAALVAKAQHYNADSWASVPVALSVGTSMQSTSLFFLDHLGAIFVSGFIVHCAWEIISPALSQLTDEIFDFDIIEKMRLKASENAENCRIGKIRTRGYGPYFSAEIELKIPPSTCFSEIEKTTKTVKTQLMDTFSDLKEILVVIKPLD
ncbi:MAG: cation transporter [Candidatus Riflebacteria bacterium]|nr:cation transporter [Candidatus Riflebacteria bacterium]